MQLSNISKYYLFMKSTDQHQKRPKIEFYSIYFTGHLIPLLKTIQILQNKNPNYDISLVTGAFTKSKFQAAFSKINMVEVDDEVDESYLKQMAALSHLECFPYIMGYMRKYFEQKTTKPDLIFADLFMLQAFNYANKNGIKFIANHPNSYTGMSGIYNFINLERSIRVEGYTILHPLPDHPFFNIFDKYLDAYRNRAVVIYDSFVGIDDPVLLPSNYTMVGLLPNSLTKHQEKDQELTNWMNGWRQNGKDKFLYISFGSLLQLSQDFTKKLVRVIQKLQYPTIWSLRSPGANQIKSKLIYNRQWLPQQQILQQEDVRGYLTHGGWGSISEAISTSTPLVCLPVFGDQAQNAKLIQKRHIGLSILQFFDNEWPQFLNVPVEQQTLVNAIRDIMEDPTYFASMKRMSRLSKTHDTAQNINKIVQRLLEFGYEYLMNPLCENATIKDNSVPIKDILVEKYWPMLEKKP